MPPTISTFGIQRLVSNLAPHELEQWEDDDGLGIPPNMTDASDDAEGVGELSASDDYGNSPLGRPMTAMEKYRSALEKRAAHEMTRPQISDHKPKGWQRALAAAANFGAGYVNAGRRTQVDPNAMRALNDGLLRPGYRGAMEKWEDQAPGVNAEVQQSGAEMQMETAQQRAANEARRVAAYEEAQHKTGALADRRLQQIDESADEFHASPTGHKLWNRKGEIRDLEPPKSPGPVKETPAEARARRAEEMKGRPDLTDEQKVFYEFNGKLPAPAKPKAGKGGGGKEKGTPGQLDKLENDTDKEYQQAEKDALKKLENAGITNYKKEDPWNPHGNSDNEKKIETVKEWLRNRKNQIARKYDTRGKALGGQVRQGGGDAYPKAGGGAKAAQNAGSVVVTLPNGKTATFADQASADAFKRKAGIQ